MKTYIFPYFLGFLILLAAGCSSTKEITLTPSGMTLQEACDEIADGGTIYLEPGTYALPKPLVLRKNVRIIGKNRNRDYVILKGDYENVLYLENGFAEIKNMTIQNTGDSKNAIDDEETEEEEKERLRFNLLHAAVLVRSPSCAFENCLITSELGHGFCVDQQDASPIVTGCTIQNCGRVGIYIINGAKGKFSNCESSGNAYSGIQVRDSGTNPTVEKCRFTDGKQSGIFVYDGASGTFRNNTLSGNRRNWKIEANCTPECVDNTPDP